MDEPTPATNDDLGELLQFFNSRRDSELARRLYLLADRLRDVAALEQAGEDAQGRLQMFRGRVREAESNIAGTARPGWRSQERGRGDEDAR